MVALSSLAIVGFFLWWSVREVTISRATFNGLLKSLGFDFEVPEKCFRSAFLKAVRDVQAGGRGKFIIRKIYKHAEEYAFGLVDETIDQTAKSLGYNHSSTLVFSPETGNLSVDFSHRAAEEIEKLYKENLDAMDSNDVREAILNIIKSWHVVGLRDRGGIYFIPVSFESQVEKLEKLVESLGGDSTLAIAPQVDVERTKKAIYKAFVTGLKDKISTFEQEVEKGTMERKSAWEKRISEFKELKAEISFYRDAMNFQADDLGIALDKLTEKVRAKIAA